VGVLGIVVSFIFLESWRAGGPTSAVHDEYDVGVSPHEHRRVRTRDVVYEDNRGDPYVERERRTTQ
jgi:hypothetical protein